MQVKQKLAVMGQIHVDYRLGYGQAGAICGNAGLFSEPLPGHSAFARHEVAARVRFAINCNLHYVIPSFQESVKKVVECGGVVQMFGRHNKGGPPVPLGGPRILGGQELGTWPRDGVSVQRSAITVSSWRWRCSSARRAPKRALGLSTVHI